MQTNSKECYHCGDICLNDRFKQDGQIFCCNGCLTVYSILKEGGLEQFYNAEERPGVKMNDLERQAYAYLDETAIADRLLLFNDGHQAKVRLYLPSIHCSSCLWLLENLYRMESSILAVKVDFAKRTALVSFKIEEISLREVAELLHSIGYPPHISLASEQQEEGHKGNKSLITKIGVTGFLFGNIMLLSFPEYLSTGIDLLEKYRWFFSGLILALSLPVLFYGASDYFSSSWKSLRQFKLVIDVPIAIGISVIFLRSVYEIYTGSGAGYLDSMAGLVFFLLIGKWYQAKIYDRLSFDKDFTSYFPLSVIRLEKDEEVNTPIMDLAEGQRIKILHQGIIPADCELESKQVDVDYSFVTGESRPVGVTQGELIYAGGRNVGGASIFKVRRPVSHSYLTDLWNQPAFEKDQGGLSSILDRASANFTLAVLCIALIAGVFWYMNDSRILMDAVTSVLIVACPCALALSVPFALGNVRRLIGKHGFFSRSTDVLETVNEIDTIVFDKTGTLTISSSEELDYLGNELSNSDRLAVAALVSQSSHPHSRAIAKELGESTTMILDFKEVPGKGISGRVNGLLYRVGSAGFVNDSTDQIQESISQSVIAKNDEVLGRFLFHRALRPGVNELISGLSKTKKCILLSGDNEGEAILFERIFSAGKMHFNMSPRDKMDFIARLQSQGSKVMMLGDGLNDAGALKQSDVGIAVSDDVDLFAPSCDVILEGDRVKHLSRFIDYIVKGNRVVRWSMLFSILYNVIGISIAVQGLLTPLIAAILMPLSSVTIVLFATLSTKYHFQSFLKEERGKSENEIELDNTDNQEDRMILNRA